MKSIYKKIAGLTFAICATSAQAGLLSFEDINPGSNLEVINNYGGFSFGGDGLSLVFNASQQAKGLKNAAIDGINAVLNFSGQDIIMRWLGNSLINFNGGYWVSDSNDSLISFEGWRDGQQIFASEMFTLSDAQSTHIQLGWADIDQVVIKTHSPTVWGMDALSFTQVPTPATPALLMLGGLGLIFNRKKRLR
ncbi:PEP-CTERM sorting domain-containing protein [Zooshikella sp. RANM57]|uniref:PEP-CTERM sorting domain-containing protein n=1 Tax=Zooshikella sp. RANM57 TaxID=3425863 RepID=UPI003D6E9157